MKKLLLAALLILCLLPSCVFAEEDIDISISVFDPGAVTEAEVREIKNSPDGFRDVKWLDHPDVLGENRKLVSNKYGESDIIFYSRPEDKLTLGNAKIDKILYAFYKDKLLRVEIYGDMQAFSDMREISIERFGEIHDETSFPESATYYHNWNDGRVMISLRSQSYYLNAPPRLTIGPVQYLKEYYADQDARLKEAAQTDF